MFNGAVRDRRAVRLGGRSTELTHDELMLRARTEREERGRAKRSLAAATRIEAFFRGRSEAHRWRRSLRATWDGHTRDLTVLRTLFESRGATFTPPAPTVLALARSLVAFFDVRLDAGRLDKMCGLSLDDASLLENDKLAEHCGAALEFEANSGQDRGPTRRYVTATVERLLGGSSPLLARLGERACAILSVQPVQPDDATARWILRGVCDEEQNLSENLRARLAVDLLGSASPSLVDFVRLSVVKGSTATLARLCHAASREQSRPAVIARLVASASRLFVEHTLANDDSDLFATAITQLIERVPAALLVDEPIITPEISSWRQEDVMDEDSSEEQDAVVEKRSEAIVLLDAAASRFVASRDRLEALTTWTTEDEEARLQLARDLGPALRRLLLSGSGVALAARIIARCARAPRAMLAGMGPQPNIVCAILDCLAFTRQGSHLREIYLKISSLTEKREALVVFCASYSQLLLGLDDEAVFVQKQPFDLGELVAMARDLGRFMQRELWNTNSKDGLLTDTALSAAIVAQLFNQLHDRIERRRPHIKEDLPPAEDLWCWPNVVLSDAARAEEDNMTDEDQPTKDATALSREPRVALVLAAAPFVVPFEQRLALFDSLIEQDKSKREGGGSRMLGTRLVIRRASVFQDAFDQFSRLDPAVLKGRVQVTFVNPAGHEEPGVDGGGVFKEFLDELSKVAFAEDASLFAATEPGHELYAAPGDVTNNAKLRRFEFCGRVIGKALYERVLVEPRFARFFLNKALGKYNYFDDLASLDAELYRHLVELKRLSDADLVGLGLNFEIVSRGGNTVVELCPGGSSIPLAASNRARYVQLVAHHRLNVESAQPSAAFLKGLRAVLPARWLRMFDPLELQTLISGDDKPIDVEDWQRNAHYGGGYHPSQPVMQWFWEIVTEFTPAERGALLRFVTSCSRPPLRGFGALRPLLSIHKVNIQSDEERLPTSGTCMNLLKLPCYSNRETMRQKLLYAVQNAHGFELS